MQVAINISKDDFEEICIQARMVEDTGSLFGRIRKAISHGTPLPKGHGRLIDADYLRNVALLHNFHGNNKSIVPYSDRKGYRLRQREVDETIINAPTIIEADTEGKE